MSVASEILERLETVFPTGLEGSVVRTIGSAIALADFPAPIGSLVAVQRPGHDPLEAEVVGFRDGLTLAYPFASVEGIRHGDRVRLVRAKWSIRVGDDLLGRVINARGKMLDGKIAPALPDRVPIDRAPPSPLSRPRITAPISTGIKAIDALLTCGKGQRMGIFSAPGVGKSVTLGMMARHTQADMNVIALVGERGREVNEFLERDLGPEGLAKSVVVVATSDEPAVMRTRAAFTATAIAEYFRDQGKDVLLMMDSLTRFALAQREISLAAGEPPTTRGFTPSVFAMLPKLVERAGLTPTGSITAFYSVLVEQDDPNEPISDAVRGLLDGHTWLSRKLASRGHYPAIDILQSLSRLMTEVTDADHLAAAQLVRELLAEYRDQEDLVLIGAYRRGSNKTVDLALDMLDQLNALLRQGLREGSTVASAREALLQFRTRCQQKQRAT